MKRILFPLLITALFVTLLVLPIAVAAQAPEITTGGTIAGYVPAAAGATDAAGVKTADAVTLRDMSWWQLFLRNMPRDYVIGYFVATVLAIIGLMVKSRRLRYLSLAGSVLFLGFMVGLRLSSLGGPSTITLILLRDTAKVNAPYFIVIGIVVLGALFTGRSFCGWVCPMGAFQQLLHRESVIKVNDRWHKYLRYLPYIILAAMVISVLVMEADFWGPNDPFRTLFRGFGAWEADFTIEVIPAILLGLTVLLSLVLFTPWCKYVCPLGALFSLISKISLFKVRLNEVKCTDCKRCAKIDCNYQAIEVGGKGTKPKINHLQCTVCGECIHKCPEQAIGLTLPAKLENARGIRWFKYSLVGVLVALSIFLIVAAAGVIPDGTTQAAPETAAVPTTAPTASAVATTAAPTTAPENTSADAKAAATTEPVASATTPAATTEAPATTAATAEPTVAPTTEPTPAAPAKPAVMTELGVALDYITPEIATNQIVEVRVRTLPGATVFIQPVNPVTGTWSAWPKFNDGGKLKVADADGLADWSWELYDSVAKGEGELIFLVTSNPDPAYTSNWKSNMTERDMNKFAEADDTIIVRMPFYVAKSDY